MALLGTVHYEVRDRVALLTIDNPPVNPMSSGVRFYLSRHLETALADDGVDAVVITGKGRAFIAGADIRDFGKTPNPDEMPKRPAGEIVESSAKPVVAAINGTAFGGGLEHALTCHYRIAAPGAPTGLPEIKIGLLPGGGGTQRLPRLIGAERAMDAILSGDPFETEEALALGIVDEIAAGDLVERALAFARTRAAAGGPHPLVRNRRDKVEADRANADVFKAGEAYLARRMRGQINGLMAFESVKAAVEIDDFDEGIRAERANFQVCHDHEQRAAMIHVFFAERQGARIPDVPADTPKKIIGSAATVGGGLMGGGIAMSFADAGIPVKVLEMNEEALDRGLGVIRTNYGRMVRGGRITQEEMDARIARIEGVLEYDAIGDADVVVEAVYENLDLKKQIFERLDATMKPGAVLASNTLGTGCRPDGRHDPAARRRRRHALLQPGQHHADARGGARRGHGQGGAGYRDGAWQGDRQDPGDVRQCARIHREPHAGRLHQPGRRDHPARCPARAGGQGDSRLRLQHGAVRDERPGGP